MAIAATATPQDQGGGFALTNGWPHAHEVNICSLDDRLLSVRARCRLKEFDGDTCGTQACKTLTIEPEDSKRHNWTIRFEVGSDVSCNMWPGPKCAGPPSALAKWQTHGYLPLHRDGNMMLSYNCHNVKGENETIEELSW
jgi:hypothetical protein